MLGDDIIEVFAAVLVGHQGMGGSSLIKFDLSSCRLNDRGLISLVRALSCNKNISQVRLNDNFFSEQIEAQLLELLNKNMHLTEVALHGNRLSHGCLAKIK